MDNKSKTLILTLLCLVSCNEPETVVTDIIRTDGSIERRIEMRSANSKFNVSDVQVPYDSTWDIKDSLEINKMGDTLRVRRAVKLFGNAAELNNHYAADSSLNKDAVRRVEFRKKFRWFDTHYSFSEIVEKRLNNGYPVALFLPDEELKWFYLPDAERARLLTGPDSLRYKTLDDSVNSHQEKWMMRSLISEWINIFRKLTGEKDVTGDIRQLEDTFYNMVRNYPRDFDSLWSKGVVLEKLIGENNAREFKNEADSAMQVIEEVLGKRFSKYSVRIIMPGKEINSNGFRDTTGVPLWQVRSEFFMTEPFIMKAESKVTNIWAWIVTVTFVTLMVAALVFPLKRRIPAA